MKRGHARRWSARGGFFLFVLCVTTLIFYIMRHQNMLCVYIYTEKVERERLVLWLAGMLAAAAVMASTWHYLC